jgi:hypothetical protein
MSVWVCSKRRCFDSANFSCGFIVGDGSYCKLLGNKPCDAVEYVEVKRGKWILNPDEPRIRDWRCSVCGDAGDGYSNYCPSCGAEMEE